MDPGEPDVPPGSDVKAVLALCYLFKVVPERRFVLCRKQTVNLLKGEANLFSFGATVIICQILDIEFGLR